MANEPPTDTKSNTAAGIRHGAAALHQRTPSIRGEGVVLGVLEFCHPWDHPDFHVAGPATPSRVIDWSAGVEDVQCTDTWGPIWIAHETHVSGTIMGNAWGGEVNSLGMAPAATLFHSSTTYQWSQRATWRAQLVSRHVVAVNSSYGDEPCNGAYVSDSEFPDEDVRATGTLMVVSAGNNGYPLSTRPDPACNAGWHTLTSMALGKNTLAIGGTTERYDPSATWIATGFFDACATTPGLCVGDEPDYTLWPSSSRGPARDGRVKPDLVAESTHCSTNAFADGTNTSPACGQEPSGVPYNFSNGTSMAAPVVTGLSGLVSQLYEEQLGARPSAAMLRGLLMHSAEDKGFLGPDYMFGWGAANAGRAAEYIDAQVENSNSRLATVTLTAGQVREFEFMIDARPTPPYGPADGEPLRLMASWIDPPGSAHTTHDLRNDIDIVLVDPAGQLHRPWSMPYARSCLAGACNPALVTAPADRHASGNHTDNVEQIVFDIPANTEGVFTLRVIAPASFGSGTSQEVALLANHDVFLPPMTADLEFCGALCPGGSGCCALSSLGSAVTCLWGGTECTLNTPVPRHSVVSIHVRGRAEAGLLMVERYTWQKPAGASVPDTYNIFFPGPQPGGTEIQSGVSGGNLTLSTPGTYRIGGRVRSRLNAYVAVPQVFPPNITFTVP